MSPSKIGFDDLSLKMYQDPTQRERERERERKKKKGNVKFVESDIVGKMRMIKDAEEIERIRRASDLEDIGIEEIRNYLKK